MNTAVVNINEIDKTVLFDQILVAAMGMPDSTVDNDKGSVVDLTSDDIDILVLHEIVGHDEIKTEMYYQVRRYECSAKDETIEQKKHTPQHFVDQHW